MADIANINWNLAKDKIGDKSYTILGQKSFFHRFGDSGFRTKWAGFWSPPYKFIEYYAYRINGEWLDSQNTKRFILKPSRAEHEYRTKDFTVIEKIFIPKSQPSMVSEISITNDSLSRKDIEIFPEIAINIRRKSENWHSRGYSCKFIAARRAVIVSSETKKENIIFGIGHPTKNVEIEFREINSYKNHYPGSEQRCYIPAALSIKASIEPKETLTIPVIYATSKISVLDVQNTYDYTLKNIESLAKEKETDCIKTIDSASISTGDADIDKSFAWAALNVKDLLHKSDFGLGLFAGMPWFIEFWGRDTFWSALALIDIGEFESAKQCMKTMLRFQKEKMPDFVDTEGNTSYLDADTDSLFLIALDYYIKHTGDKKILRELKDNIKKSLASLKLDSDFVLHQPDETWMDSCKRIGTAVEIQSLWVEALKRHNEKLSREMLEMLEKFFWNSNDKYILDTFGKEPDRSLTINPAVPIMLGHFPKEESMIAIEKINTEFKSRYGARTRSVKDREYDGKSYHKGSVWGLTTGWAACANLSHGLPEEGLYYLKCMADDMLTNNLGAMSECVNADTGDLLGAHMQAWSSAFFVHAIDSYLFGIKPDIEKSRIDITPCIPSKWSYLSRKNKIIGSFRLDIEIKKKENEIEIKVAFDNKQNLGVKIDLNNLAQKTGKVMLNGKDIKSKNGIIEFKAEKENIISVLL